MPYPGGRRNTIDKQHTCVGCGCVFRYTLDLSEPGPAFMSTIASKPADVVATHPCPGCGLIQPEMVLWSKVCHPLTSLLALLALIVFAALGLVPGGPSPALCAQMAIAAFATLALIHFATAFANPNRNPDANLSLAKKEIAAGKLVLVRAGSSEQQGRPPGNLGFWHVLALLLLLVGPLAFIHPATALAEVPDTPTNPGLDPEVITPGDRVSFTFRNVKEKGVTGQIWKGRPTVRVINAKALGIPETLVAEGSDQDWGSTLHVPKGSYNQPLDVTIHFTIPNKPELVGKSIALTITMRVKYPEMWGSSSWIPAPAPFGSSFANRTINLSDSMIVKVADNQQVQASKGAYLIGVFGGSVFLLGSLVLTALTLHLRNHASPSEVLPAPLHPPNLSTIASAIPPPAADDDDLAAKMAQVNLSRGQING
jgi:hypothetical protein